MTNCGSASDEAGRPCLLAAAWRPAGLLYLALVLAGLAAGLWPESIVPTPRDVRSAVLPTLRTVAVAQVAFVLLIHPLVILTRSQRGTIRRYWPEVLVESAALLVVTAPLYLAAAYLADAVAADVVRAAIYVVCLWTFAWSAGKWLTAGRRARWAVLLILLLAAAGMPAGYYIIREFLAPAVPAEWIWNAGPATFAWQAAASRDPSWFPRPLWAALLWPGLAALGVLLDLALPKVPATQESAGGAQSPLQGR